MFNSVFKLYGLLAINVLSADIVLPLMVKWKLEEKLLILFTYQSADLLFEKSMTPECMSSSELVSDFRAICQSY